MKLISTNNMKKYFGIGFENLPNHKNFILDYLDPITDYGTRVYKPSSDKKNIICCGCSMTWGSEVEYNESYPYLLNEILKSDEYQILNIGHSGAGLKFVVEWFKFLTKSFNPHMCILQIPNMFRQPFFDFQENNIIFHGCRYGIPELLNRKHLNLFDLIQKRDLLIKLQFEILIDFIKFLRFRNIIPIVLIIYFREKNKSLKMITNEYLDIVFNFLIKECIYFIDFDEDEFLVHNKKNSKMIMPQGHYSKIGNFRIAKTINDDIFETKKNKIFKSI